MYAIIDAGGCLCCCFCLLFCGCRHGGI